jgi:predicted pyridoxine 5'-phosphate oxidase superfamily flavin-nucleotide-binding protein
MATTWWHEGELSVQRRAGVTNHDKLRNGVRDALPPHFRDFLAAQRFVVLATRDAGGLLWCSMVPGWPAFASAPTPETIAVDRRAFVDPDVLAQLQADPQVGLLAFDPSTRRRIRINGVATIGDTAVLLHLVECFGNCQQYIQKRAAEGPEPHALTTTSRASQLEPSQRNWIARADTCFLASVHPTAGPDASHRGGRPGFVAVLDSQTIEFHDYPGNDMFQSLGNLTADPTAAMLFVDFSRGATLQLSGDAIVVWNVPASPTGRTVRFTVREAREKHPALAWQWPIVEYSPVNP